MQDNNLEEETEQEAREDVKKINNKNMTLKQLIMFVVIALVLFLVPVLIMALLVAPNTKERRNNAIKAIPKQHQASQSEAHEKPNTQKEEVRKNNTDIKAEITEKSTPTTKKVTTSSSDGFWKTLGKILRIFSFK